jgi:predicted metal-dependent hydrolase
VYEALSAEFERAGDPRVHDLLALLVQKYKYRRRRWQYLRRRHRSGEFELAGDPHVERLALVANLSRAYVSIRQHTSAYVAGDPHVERLALVANLSAAYVSIRQHTSAYVSIRQHTSAYVSITAVELYENVANHARREYAAAHDVVPLLRPLLPNSVHTSAYVSIRQHTSAYVRVCRCSRCSAAASAAASK